jgi:hypothetical protein
MKKQATILNGEVINVGDWDYQPYVDADNVQCIGNPMPDGAQTGEYELEETAAGRLVLAENYRAMRAAEYPSIGDQLDAIWKGEADAEAMRVRIFSVKLKYPKA